MDSALQHLAEESGLILCYRDALGVDRTAPDSTVRATLAALGRPAETEAEAQSQLDALRAAKAERLCPPVVIAGPDGVAAPIRGAGQITWRITAEDGRTFDGEATIEHLPEGQGEDGGPVRWLGLPGDLPEGYHRLHLECGGGSAEALLIRAPATCYLPPSGQRRWGVSLQLYSLQSDRNAGLGDYSDLAEFARIAAGEGAHFVGLNPLHALFPADPHHFGPYSPSSRAFLNTFYVDPAAAPGFAQSAEAQRLMTDAAPELAANRAETLVDYVRADQLKRPVLEALWSDFTDAPDGPDMQRFEMFVNAGGDALARHALFEALHEHFFADDPGKWSWRSWPEPYQRPDSPEVSAFGETNVERVLFFSWLQWLAHEQLAAADSAARRAGMEIGLYQDLAVGVDPGGAASWADQDMVAAQLAVGAPPDELNPRGQNWGLSPYDPEALAAAGFAPFIRDVRAAMRHAGAVRLDHVMALQRLFCIPRGAPATEGLYLRYPRDAMLAIIALESQRQKCVVIGEDLGTVPEGFREAVGARDVLTYKVLYFERVEGGLRSPQDYPGHALATVTTHDLPTLRGFLAAKDLDLMHTLGLYPDEAIEQRLRGDRVFVIEALYRMMTEQGLLEHGVTDPDAIVAAAYGLLARAPSLLLAVSAEDLAAAVEQPNLPGTTDEHPNWRRKLPASAGELFATEGARRLLDAVRRERPPE